MLPAPLLTLLEGLELMGVKFVLMGDWHQLQPPMNRWRADPVRGDAFESSRLLHLWSEGTEFRMARCRRSGREFFEFCESLLPLSLEEGVRKCRQSFPPGPGPLYLQADIHLVLSHHRRRSLNKQCQEAATVAYRASTPDGLVVSIEAPVSDDKKLLNTAQTFDLFEGTRLIGSNNETKHVVNGSFLKVGEVRPNDCDVTDEHNGEVFVLTHLQLAQSTRLAWAITVLASQSREFDSRVCLWDLGSRHYSKRSLYVAMTRVRRPELLVVAP